MYMHVHVYDHNKRIIHKEIESKNMSQLLDN